MQSAKKIAPRLFGFLVFAAIVSCTNEIPPSDVIAPSDVTQAVFIHDRNQDGIPDLRQETYKRDGKKVFAVRSRRLTRDRWAVVRSYYAGNTLVALEEDSDGDGGFETFIVVLGMPEELEVFTRTKDGSIKVGALTEKQRYQTMFRATSEFWDKLLTETNSSEIDGSLEK